MSLVFDRIGDCPQTHVLIIGIGGYPWLKDGLKWSPGQNVFFASMGQLSSAPVSAAAFYKTVIDLHEGGESKQDQWIRPLGSIELLISDVPGTHPILPSLEYDGATWENIYEAYRQWKKRCDSHPDNVAIFYFCGHGLEKANQYLLAEDFGKLEGNPWRHAINIDQTRRAFHGCKAETQVFFIDACRLVALDFLDRDIDIAALDHAEHLGQDCKYNLTQKAAAHNESAFGRVNTASIYTSALIKVLRGQAASVADEEWVIETRDISGRIHELMDMVEPGQGYDQRCTHTSNMTTTLIRFNEPPDVIISLTCDPEEALAVAELSCLNADSKALQSRPPLPTPWDVNVKAGIYLVSARFLEDRYRPASKHVTANPPIIKKALRCL
jgi:hypothetical protein